MAPLATAFVMVMPNMTLFAAQTAAGVRAANLSGLGAVQGSMFGTAFSRSAAKLIAAGAVIGFGVLVKEAVQAAGNFEAAMVRLTTSAGETGTLVSGNLKIVADGIKNMAASVGFSVTDLGKAMYLVESAGFRAADGLNVLRFAAEASKAENSDLTTVVDALTTAMIDYHKPASDAANVMNTLLAAAATSKVNLQDLAASLHSVLPAASRAGIGLNDILGALSSMTLHGYSAQQATQNLADVIRHMQNPTNVQARELALLGLTTNQLAEDLRSKGLTGTLQLIAERIAKLMPPGSQQVILDMRTALSKLSPEVQKLGNELIKGSLSFADYRKAARALDPVQNAQAMSFYQLAAATHRIGDEQMSGAKVLQVFGQALARATGDATGMNVALMLTGENAETTNDIVRRIGEAALEAGGHIKGWAAIQETFNFKMAQTKAALGVVGVALGQSLLPLVGMLMKGITAILIPMASWITGHQRLTSIIMGSLGAFVALGTGVLIVTKLAAGFKALAVALRLAAIAQFLFLSPWGLIVVAIAAVVGALVYAYFHFDTFRRFVDKLWQSLKAASKDVWAALVVAFHAIGDAAVWLWDHALGPAFRAIGDASVWLWQNALGPAFRGMLVAIKAWWEYAQFAFGIVKAIILTVVVPYVTWMWQHIWEPAFKGMLFAVKAWWEYAQFAFGIVKAIILNVVVPYVTWMWQHIWEPAFKAMGVVIKVWWEYAQIVFNAIRVIIMDVFVPAVMWMWHNVWEPAWGAMQHVVQASWVVLQVIFQVIKLWIENYIIQPMLFLWHNVFEPAWHAISLLVAIAWATIKPIFTSIGDGATSLGKTFMALWRTYVEPAWNGIKLVIALVWEAIKPIFNSMLDFVTRTIPDGFRKGVDLAKTAWEGLKAGVREPINWVIRFVINDGIIKAWNFLADKFGVKDHITPVPEIGAASSVGSTGGGGGGGTARAMADGGRVYGFGGGRQDAVPIMASAGEYIIPANVVSDIGVRWFDGLIGKRKPEHPGDGSSGIAIGRYAAGGLIGAVTDPAGWVGDQVNHLIAKIPGAGIVHDIGVAASRRLVAGLIEWVKSKVASFFGGTTSYLGPITGSPAVIAAWLQAQHGKPYGWAQAGPNSYDCSGIVSSVWNMMHGVTPYRHTFSTSGQGLFFPKRNQFGALTAGWANPGEKGGGSVGHTAANFMGLGFESTGSRGVRVGTGTTPVTNFAHWGTFADGGLIRSFDRGGPWPSGVIGINTSGKTEQVSSGSDMAELIHLIRESNALARRQLVALEQVGSDVGAELTGVSSRMRRAARIR